MKFALITPAKQVASFTARYVNVPGEAGDFGVMPGHMPLMSTLRAGGTVRVTDANGTDHHYTLAQSADGSAGFADVRADSVTLMVEALADEPATPVATA